MQLDKLQLDLRPRPHWQALDLGHSLLREHAAVAIKAWLVLWLPLCVLTAILIYVFPATALFIWLLPWWLRPLLERVLIFIYSRAVFGERVSVRQALRAWPSQLGGGWIRLLTLWRLFMPGRGLYQAIWQLEGARGDIASNRIRVLGRDGCGPAAYWFGAAFSHFEIVLQLGLIGLIGFFLSDAEAMNPFALLFVPEAREQSSLVFLNLLGITLSGALIAPIYVACTFALYLNRRAELEAWDVEIVFRQMQPRTAAHKNKTVATPVLALLLLCGLTTALLPAPASAQEAAPTLNCEGSDWFKTREKFDAWQQKDGTAEQHAFRERLQKVYLSDELRNFRCVDSWKLKDEFKSDDKDKKEEKDNPFSMSAAMVEFIKVLLLLMLAGYLIYLLIRFHAPLLRAVGIRLERKPMLATAIAGLDIRPESLPDNVIAEVHRLWQLQQKRAALALLYRASLSRLATHSKVEFMQGATEGECLRKVQQAAQSGALSDERATLFATVTDMWISIAYAGVSPRGQTVQQHCDSWRQFMESAQ